MVRCGAGTGLHLEVCGVVWALALDGGEVCVQTSSMWGGMVADQNYAGLYSMANFSKILHGGAIAIEVCLCRVNMAHTVKSAIKSKYAQIRVPVIDAKYR